MKISNFLCASKFGLPGSQLFGLGWPMCATEAFGLYCAAATIHACQGDLAIFNDVRREGVPV